MTVSWRNGRSWGRMLPFGKGVLNARNVPTMRRSFPSGSALHPFPALTDIGGVVAMDEPADVVR